MTAALLASTIVCNGCAHTETSLVARCDATNLHRVETVRSSGVYEPMWTPSDKAHLQPLPGSDHYATRGAQLGFDTSPDGKLLAVHDGQRDVIGRPPARAKYVAWFHRETKQTAFTRTMQRANGPSEIIAGDVALGVMVIGFGWLAVLNPAAVFDALTCDPDDFHDLRHHARHNQNPQHPASQPAR